MNVIKFCNLIIAYSFYCLFFFVPLFFLSNTSELFELNKMWLTWGLTLVIGAAWISKIIIEKKIIIRKTPLDIPILLFLVSQIISTIFSLDSHVSLWGYYTRFNGGLFSTISYIFLYYAIVTNLEVKHIFRILFISLITGLATVIWGFPSHFGYDPTCYLFRGSLDTDCWTEAFKPTIRAFSTLGQPAWFAAYLNILLPIAIANTIIKAKQKKIKTLIAFFILTLLFYVSLIFANTRAGTDAFYAVNILFWLILFYKRIFSFKIILKYFLVFHIAFAVCNFFYGAPASSLDKFIYPLFQKKIVAHAQTTETNTSKPTAVKTINITDSWDIRQIVWKGAVDAWKANPIFGTGVETFAFAYYQYRPSEHNLTSEWDYLYNKAHNEYLNYLTTTGILGLGSYLAIIFVFLFIVSKYILLFTEKEHEAFLIVLAIFSAYLSILITNFSGFSVVIINLYLFLIPAFLFLIIAKINPGKNFCVKLGTSNNSPINLYQWTLIFIVIIIMLNLLFGLFRYWYADTQYALGFNLDRAALFQEASPLLQSAVGIEPDEPVYKDELAVNLATLAASLYLQNDATRASQFSSQALILDNQVIDSHPNNVVFWKNRLRILYGLASADAQNQSKYMEQALLALYKSSTLAPTDAKIAYNLGVLLGQTGNLQEAVKVLEKTIKLKSDYFDAYNALGLLYHQLAIGGTPTASSSGQELIVDPRWEQKAIATYQYILDNISPNNEQIKNTLNEWKKR